MQDISRTGAYCVRTSNLKEGIEAVCGALADARAPHTGDDFLLLQKTTISIDDVRALQEFHDQHSTSDQKTILCVANFITTQAQNGLLKLIEETKEGERIFLIVSHETELLPTILSRVQIESIQNSEVQKEIASFVQKLPHERLAFVETEILSIEESDQKRDALLLLLRGLESHLHGTGDLKRYKDILTAIPTLRQMLSNPGAPAKMIAEYVALGF